MHHAGRGRQGFCYHAPPMRLRALLVAVTLGCSDPGGQPDAGVDALSSACTAGLQAFCDAACPDYQASVAEVMRLAGGARCFMAESGSCGAARYTAFSSGFFGFTAWFGADGALVGAHRYEDTPAFCDETSHDQVYGAPPACDRVATAEYCP